MNSKLANIIKERLKASEFWTTKTRDNGNTIQRLICPVCEDKNAWAYSNEPYSINCNRTNNCGTRTNTRELFEIVFDIEKEYKPLPNDKLRPAREYLKSRGLNTSTLKDLDFRYWPNVRNLPTGAVMFPVGQLPPGKDCYNGRLINPLQNEGKTHNSGSTAGLFWSHPGIALDKSRPIAITEGIIDALSLIQMGIQAIAVLSSGQDPTKLKGLEEFKIVCAFDNDQAGTAATRKYLNTFSGSSAIMPPPGLDWNIILQSNQENPEQAFKENEKRYEQNATLALAESAHEYGKLYYEFFSKSPGLFAFAGSTWFGQLRTKGDVTNHIIERVGLFTIEVVAFINAGTAIQKEYLYHLNITPYRERPVTCIAPGRTLSTAKDFSAFLLSNAKVNFEGNATAIKALATKITTTKAPEVRRVPVAGYDTETSWYVYDGFAIDKTGAIHTKDNRGLFKIGPNSMITPAPQAAEKAITPATSSNLTVKDIYTLFYQAWNTNGAIAFSWVIASWFVNQIKKKENFFPFLSFHGDPAAGKSALTSKLQAIQGRNIEGLPLSQLNTKKGLARTMAGFSGMFTALLEDNQRNERSFDYSTLLTLYNIAPIQVQAKFTNTLETQDNPFLGSLLFVQNNEPFNQKAEKQRVISLHFKTDHISASTSKAFKALNAVDSGVLVRVLVETLSRRADFESKWYEEYLMAAADLEQIKEERIRNNHALILAFNRIFCRVFDIDTEDLFTAIEKVAIEKEHSSAEMEINEASTFFDQIYSLETEQIRKYWHEVEDAQDNRLDYNSLYFSLHEISRLLQNNGLNPPRSQDLQKSLKAHPAYLAHGKNHRFPTTAEETHTIQRKSWRFDLSKFREIESPPNKIE